MPGDPHHLRPLTVICVAWTALILLLHFMVQRYLGAERAAIDWLTTNPAAQRSPAHPRIVFLGIDDASRNLDSLFAEDLEKSPALRLMKQGFPWNREIYPLIIERLAAAGAKVIVFDLIFPNPREGDERFREALERFKDRVVIGGNLIDSAENKVSYTLPSPTVLPSQAMTDPLVGFVNVKADDDRIVRRVTYRATLIDGTELLSLPARALEKCGLRALIPKDQPSGWPRFADEFLPRSLYEIFVENMWEAPPYNRGEFFRDKIVLIGAAGNESEDRLLTPHGAMLGPLIHLNAINAALNRDFLTATSTPVNLALMVAGGALTWVLGAFLRRPAVRLILIVTTAVAYYGIAQHVFFNQFGIAPILLSPLLTLMGSGLTWAVWEQVRDRLERQRTRRALERYVGQDVAHEVLDNPTSYLNALVGARKEITVLFSDVRGFTTLSENTDPQALVTQLNEYFEAMVSIVFAHQGTLDKFIGDAVMAHWGSIVSDGPVTDATRAITTVLQMRKALARLNTGWRARGIREMRVGYGVNHGDAIVGNLGCEAKMEVSVIGDAVNLGSRLEGVTKQYHIDICIGEQAAALVRDGFILRSVDLIVVKGKTKPVEVFTVLDKRNPATAEPAWLARHEEAVRLYRAGGFAAAERAWREVLAVAPGDGLAEVFIARCVELQKEPPEGPWTGVYEMKSK